MRRHSRPRSRKVWAYPGLYNASAAFSPVLSEIEGGTGATDVDLPTNQEFANSDGDGTTKCHSNLLGHWTNSMDITPDTTHNVTYRPLQPPYSVYRLQGRFGTVVPDSSTGDAACVLNHRIIKTQVGDFNNYSAFGQYRAGWNFRVLWESMLTLVDCEAGATSMPNHEPFDVKTMCTVKPGESIYCVTVKSTGYGTSWEVTCLTSFKALVTQW